MSKIEISELYQDLDLNLIPHPLTGDIVTVKNQNAVIKSLKHLILMDAYDIPYEAHYTTGIRKMIFDNFSPLLESTMVDRIKWLAEKLEQRVKIKNVVITPSIDNASIDIEIVFTMETQGDENITMSVTLQRER